MAQSLSTRIAQLEAEVAVLKTLAQGEPTQPTQEAKPTRKSKTADSEPRCIALKGNGKRCRQHGADKVGDDGLCEWHRDAAKRGNVARVDDEVVVSTPAKAAAKGSKRKSAAGKPAAGTCKGTRKDGTACSAAAVKGRSYCIGHLGQESETPAKPEKAAAKGGKTAKVRMTAEERKAAKLHLLAKAEAGDAEAQDALLDMLGM